MPLTSKERAHVSPLRALRLPSHDSSQISLSPRIPCGLRIIIRIKRQRVDRHPELGEPAKRLGEQRQDDRGEHGAETEPMPPRDHHDHDVERLLEPELARVQRRPDLVREQAARDPRERRREDEGADLQLRRVDPDRLGRDLVLTDREEGAAVARELEVQRDDDGDRHEQVHPEQVGVVGEPGKAERPAQAGRQRPDRGLV